VCWRLLMPRSAQGRMDPLGGQAVVLAMSDEEDEHWPALWGFAQGSPVRITYNANVPMGVAHGAEGRLVGLSLSQEERDFALPLMRQAAPGSVITLRQPPLAVLVRAPGAPSLGNPVTLPCQVSDRRRTQVVTVGQGIGGPLRCSVIDPGYELAFAITFHSVQGATLRRVVLDLNFNSLMPSGLPLSSIYVGLSRVRRGLDLRVLPTLSSTGIDHLLQLEHTQTGVKFTIHRAASELIACPPVSSHGVGGAVDWQLSEVAEAVLGRIQPSVRRGPEPVLPRPVPGRVPEVPLFIRDPSRSLEVLYR
jgi:hypothetical protein